MNPEFINQPDDSVTALINGGISRGVVGAEMGSKRMNRNMPCPHKIYCPGDCKGCDGDALDAAKHILQSRGQYPGDKDLRTGGMA